jgi:GTPase involved in cell partitioning and DNA repair
MTPDGTPGGISTPFAIGPDGTVFGSEFPSSGARGFYIKGPAYGTGAFLPGNDVIHAMNSLGQAVGESDPGGGNFGNALFWSAVTATPTTVQSGSPGNQAISALVIFDNDIIKTGDDYGNFYWVKRN